MNEEQLKGKWLQLRGKVKQRWGRLTDDDLDLVQGRRDELIGRLEERYGIAKEEAQKQFREFLDNFEGPAEQDRRAA